MIEPTQNDIGRRVLYVERYGGRHPLVEHGSIVRFNKEFVFVKYDDHATPQATNRRDLFWEDPKQGGKTE